MNLPFIDPDYSYQLNACTLLGIVCNLNRTKKGKLVLNNDRVHQYLCLIKNPSILAKALELSGKEGAKVDEVVSYSIASIAPSFDLLFDVKAVRVLVSSLIARGLISVEYSDSKGFFYIPTEYGTSVFSEFSSEYIYEINDYCKYLLGFQSKSISQINSYLNKVLLEAR